MSVENCHQCNLEFEESSIAFCKRLRLNSKKICRDCNRIEMAEERANRRIKDEPKLSLLQIMRTQKVTYQEALKISNK